jgi:16S rRNA (uracil1498-N3)-methyltransferase
MRGAPREQVEKHEFALYVESLSRIMPPENSDILSVSDEKIIHRIVHVLRLVPQDCCIFFDRHVYALVKIVELRKKDILCVVQYQHKTTPFQPRIIFLLPVLKRDNFETALYSLTELGVNTIQLIFTHKTTHQWSNQLDADRAQRIIIAAAEQSKNFAYPELENPLFLNEALKKYHDSSKLFFDPAGKPLCDVIEHVRLEMPQNIVLCVGPEGDLQEAEKKIMKEQGFIFCALTSTVIRSVQAAALAAGLIRSLFVSQPKLNVFK